MTSQVVRASVLSALAIAAAGLVACGGTEPTTPVVTVPAEQRDYLIDPISGYPLEVAPPEVARIRDLFSRLTNGGDPAVVEAEALRLAEQQPSLLAAKVVAAQAVFLRRQNQRALDLLAPVVDELPDYLAAALLAARAEEQLALIPEAFERYSALAAGSRFAAVRAEELRPRAAEIIINRFEDALSRGRFDEAETHLGRLEGWQGGDERTLLDARRRLLFGSGDRPGELEIIRRLVEESPEPGLLRRRGELEIEIGEVRTGLDIFEKLATADPEDPEVADWLARAKFLWRLELLPPEVQALGRQGELDRADLATLLYWLFPDVRYSEVEDPPIAADILEHPRRREILRVLDVDLLGVDETLHRFRPADPATRRDLLASLLTLMIGAEQPLPCLSGEVAARAASRSQSWVCSRAADCQLIEESLACLPAATLAGGEALELVRSAQDLSGAR